MIAMFVIIREEMDRYMKTRGRMPNAILLSIGLKRLMIDSVDMFYDEDQKKAIKQFGKDIVDEGNMELKLQGIDNGKRKEDSFSEVY